jgi:ribosomal protein S18 acetylase RimI-like enzyme
MSAIQVMPDNARASTCRRRATAGRTAVRRVTPQDWLVLRDLRLRALRSDPLSFGSTYEREAAFSEGDWMQWAADDALGDEMATFIADRERQPMGIVGAYRDESEPMLFHVIAMWVAPEGRREGLGRRLLSHVEAWIRSCGGRVVQLNVTTTAVAARRLYETAGFEPDGDRRESRHTRGLVEVSLRKRLF